MFSFSELIKTIKKYAVNSSVSNERFLNAFITPYVAAGDIKNKNSEPFYLNKTRVSLLLNQKEDVPVALREALPRFQIRKETEKNFEAFISDELVQDAEENITESLIGLIEEAENLSAESKMRLLRNEDNLSCFLTDLLFEALVLPNIPVEEEVVLLNNSSSKVTILIGDLFRFGFKNRSKTKNIVVIPVNTAFDTHITRMLERDPKPIVSDRTIHGQWLVRWKESGNDIQDLDDRIEQSLKIRGFYTDEVIKDDNRGKRQYPIGSIAVLDTNNAVYYLLAVSSFDKNNVARSSAENIKKALIKLLEFYDVNGQGYDLYIPLIGTGRSRAGLSLQDAYNLITTVLKDNKDKIYGNIHVVLEAETAKAINIRRTIYEEL